MIRSISHTSRHLRRAAACVALASLLLCVCAGAAGAKRSAAPSRGTVIEVQRLFHQLGYPLGRYEAGVLGVSTRGALSYFQRKYRLPVTGEPDARTVADMRSVAAGLRGPSQPHDIVERVFGEHLPIFAIAVALACLLAVLALGSRTRSGAQDSTADAIAVSSRES